MYEYYKIWWKINEAQVGRRLHRAFYLMSLAGGRFEINELLIICIITYRVFHQLCFIEAPISEMVASFWNSLERVEYFEN